MDIFKLTELKLADQGLRIDRFDFERPWGGFFVIDENQSQLFADLYFEGLDIEPLRISGGKLSPKILLVKPESRLSWQFHHRRAETWRVIQGPVGVIRSNSDEEGQMITMSTGEVVVLHNGERHRLVGLENWGVVAEFWQHMDADNPSDEEDIVRLQDDYSRA